MKMNGSEIDRDTRRKADLAKIRADVEAARKEQAKIRKGGSNGPADNAESRSGGLH